jgi:hypothetical protein
VRKLRKCSNGCTSLQAETLQFLPLMLEGAIRESPYGARDSQSLLLTPATQSVLGSKGTLWTDATQVTTSLHILAVCFVTTDVYYRTNQFTRDREYKATFESLQSPSTLPDTTRRVSVIEYRLEDDRMKAPSNGSSPASFFIPYIRAFKTFEVLLNYTQCCR